MTYNWIWVGDYSTQVDNAVGDWNATSVPGSIQWNGSTAGAHITFNRISSAQNYWGVTEGQCSGGKWSNGNVTITLNDATMVSLTGLQKRRVIVHEVGHAYGLDHPGFTSCSQTPAVMVQGQYKWTCGWSGTPPWGDDVNGVKAIYG